jgi:hypothetical protein
MRPFDTAPRDGTEFYALIDGLPYLAWYDEMGRFVWVMHRNIGNMGETWELKKFDGVQWQRKIKDGKPASWVKNVMVWIADWEFSPSHWMEKPVLRLDKTKTERQPKKL